MKRTHFHALYFLLSDFKFILLNIKQISGWPLLILVFFPFSS